MGKPIVVSGFGGDGDKSILRPPEINPEYHYTCILQGLFQGGRAPPLETWLPPPLEICLLVLKERERERERERCNKMVAKRLLSSSSYIMFSEATRRNIRGCKIKNSPGAACPQTPLDGHAYIHTVLILSICPPPLMLGAKHLPLLEQNPEINPVLVHENQAFSDYN